MKKTKLFYFVVLFCMIFTSTSGFALTAGDFQSQATGNWSAIGTWQTYDGAAWNAAVALPDLTQAITVTIQAGHTVTVDAAYTANNAALNIVVNGYLKETGIITKTAGIWTINGTYEFNHAPAANQGLPTATWNDGSTCSFTGLTTSTVTGINATQSFYNIIFNCPNSSASINLGWNTGTITIRGNFTVNNTGSGRLQICAPTAGTSSSAINTVTVNIGGNIVVDGTNAVSTATGVIFSSNGTSNNYTAVVINVAGNVTVTGNSALAANNAFTVFAISKGSQGTTGTTVWNFSGDVSIANATLQNSNPAGGKCVFAKNGTQALTLSNIFTTTAAPFNLEVSSTTTLNIGNSILTPSSGFFTLNAGSGIITSHASGLDGNLTNTGTKTLSTAANYTFNGSSAQLTGALLPTTVNNLTISNPAGVTLSASTTASAATTVNAGSILKTGGFTFTNNGTATINGSFQVDQGGWATGTSDFVYGPASTLIFNNTTGSYGVASDARYWPYTGGPKNVTVGAGGITLNAWRSVDGLIQTVAGVTISTGQKLTVNGQLQINSGGWIGNISPEYGATSSLIYNAGAGGYTTSLEWPSILAPFNVEIKNATPVTLSASSTIAGTLSLTSGKIALGANDLTIGTAISGASTTNYIVTDGMGKVNVPAASAVATLIPIGASATSYDPVTVTPATASTFGAKVSGTLSGSANPGITYNPKEWTLTSTSASSTTLAFKPSAEDATVSSMIANSPYYALIGKATGGGSYTNSNIIYNSGTYSATFSSFGSFVSGVNSNATAITNAAQTSVNVYAAASQLIVDGTLAGDMISVYGLNGQTVAKVAASAKQTALNLNQGLYLVNVKSVEKTYNFKVILK